MSGLHFPLLTSADYQPAPPAKKSRGIGIYGCGGIVRGAHLPAYQACGYRVLAATDLNPDALRDAAARFGIPKTSTDPAVVLNDPEIQIVDLAVHAKQRRPVIEKIVQAGKHVFSQKPFAMSFAEARAMVELCAQGGVKLMVNQQARWAPGHRAVKALLEKGLLGHVYSLTHVLRGFQDKPGTWYTQLENFNIVDHGIHYLDLSRFFTGRSPLRVKCTTTSVPGQAAVSPMLYSMTLEYEPRAEVMATLHFNNIVQVAGVLGGSQWYVDGTEGSLILDGDDLKLALKADPRTVHTFKIQGRWFPDAFGGSMGEMLQALEEDREPQTSGRDNLQSIAIAEAAVRSSKEGRAVDLKEVLEEA